MEDGEDLRVNFKDEDFSYQVMQMEPKEKGRGSNSLALCSQIGPILGAWTLDVASNRADPNSSLGRKDKRKGLKKQSLGLAKR